MSINLAGGRTWRPVRVRVGGGGGTGNGFGVGDKGGGTGEGTGAVASDEVEEEEEAVSSQGVTKAGDTSKGATDDAWPPEDKTSNSMIVGGAGKGTDGGNGGDNHGCGGW